MDATRLHQPVYLKPEAKIEPLACRWYVWPHLLSPAQHALNLLFHQVPLLKSYVSNPAVHAAASRDPELLCAPFIQLGPDFVAEMRKLLENIEKRCTGLLSFAADWRAFARKLQETADGTALDGLYRDLPASLAGVVELAYDVNDHPSARVLEEMLYEGALPNEHTQELSIWCGTDHDRKFFLNTPRLPGESRLDLQMPFTDPRIDVLAALRLEPLPLKDVIDTFALDQEGAARLDRAVTSTPPARYAPNYRGDGVRLRYFGHACVLVQSARTSVLFDPVVAWDGGEGGAGLTFHDLPDHIDYTFLTHNHQDHVSAEVLLQLRSRIGRVLTANHNRNSIADPSLARALGRLGMRNVTPVDPLTRVDLPGGRLTTIPFFGEHGGLDIHSKHATLLELEGRRFLFMADSDCADPRLYERLKPLIGEVDMLFLGMECHGAPLSWLYGPYLTRPVARKADETRRLSGANCERAWQMIQQVGCKQVFVYAMGQESWLTYLLGLAYTPDSIQIVESNRLVERCRAQGIPAERLNGCREMQL
jgi:L-ascorbate metabolism protein UlaG (beta-lactamase superfamily)